MKAISLLQPWAQLVVMGEKAIETRSWSTAHRGKIYIHASKRIDAAAMEMCKKFPFNQFIPDIYALPTGAIIGSCEITNCNPSEGLKKVLDEFLKNKGTAAQAMKELAFGDYSRNRFGFILSNPVQFKEPIPCKGALSIWDVPVEIQNLLNKQP